MVPRFATFSRMQPSSIAVVLACWAYTTQGRRVHISKDDTSTLIDLDFPEVDLLNWRATNHADTLAMLLLARAPSFAISAARLGSRIQLRSPNVRGIHRQQKDSSVAARVPAVLMSNNDSEEREETKKYVTYLGGILIAVTLAIVGLTDGLGLDDEAAGALVIFVLTGITAYLAFADDASQVAIQNEGVQQVVNQEELTMDQAPRADVKVFLAQEVIVEPRAASAALQGEGYVRINNVLSPEASDAILQHINAKLAEKIEQAKDNLVVATMYFGEVLQRQQRYDLFLDMEPSVRGALEEAMKSLKPVFESLVGPDAELFELAALVADPRAPRQPVHPDTSYKECDDRAADIGTAYIALQDIEVDMGPTFFLPRTNTAEAHKRFNVADDAYRSKSELLRETPRHVGLLKKGDANLIDSRLLHGGGENISNKRRVLLYISFKRKDKVMRGGSMKFEFRNANMRLDNTDEWLSENRKLVA